MTVFTRDQLHKVVGYITKKNTSQVYLLFGERYLCQQAAEKITHALLAGGGIAHVIDGNNEDLAV